MELSYARICRAVEEAVPDRECLVFRDRHITWAAMGDRTNRLASVLHGWKPTPPAPLDAIELWESPHAHVALYLYNGNEYLEGMLGAYKARWAPVNVNYRYKPPELAHVLGDSRARAVIYHRAFGPTLAEAVPLLQDPAQLEHLVEVDDGSDVPSLPGALRYEDLLATADPGLPRDLTDGWTGDDLYICYTGGTTGMPKGVLWRQADFLVSALGTRRRDGSAFESYDEFAVAAQRSKLRALPAAPLMHGAAHWNAMSCWATGGTVLIQDRPDRLDPPDVLSTAQRERATSLLIVGDPFAVPLLDELDAARAAGTPYDLSSLRHILSGGAILSPDNRTKLLDHLPTVRIVDVLGSTESGRQAVAQIGTADAPDTRFSAESTAIVLSDDLTTRAQPGERGWLAQTVRVPRGYLGDPEKSNATFPVVDGVRYSIAGDRARYDDDGVIELLGRESVTINTGGEKVFAEEVETALKTHPAVFDAVVCGRPSERWGQEIVALVQLRDGAHASREDLVLHCKKTLADYKAPKAVIQVDRVERSPSGKADYRWAKERAQAAAGQD